MGVTGAAELEALCANALAEAAGQEAALACDPRCSRVLQDLLERCSTPQQAASFLAAAAGPFCALGCHACASHVLEACLRAVAAHVDAPPEAGTDASRLRPVEDSLATICKVGVESTLPMSSRRSSGGLHRAVAARLCGPVMSWPDLDCDAAGDNAVAIMRSKYGSHVLRNLLALLCGHQLAEPQAAARPDQQRRQALLAGHPSASGTAAVNGARRELFAKLLNSLLEALMRAIEDEIHSLRVDPAAGPVLQAMLAAAEGDEAWIRKMAALFLSSPPIEKPKLHQKVLKAAPMDDAHALLQDRFGSHLMEAMLRVSSAELYHKLYTEYYMGHLHKLSMHPTANYTVQALMACAKYGAQVRMIAEELEGHLAELLVGRRAGVICAALAEAVTSIEHPTAAKGVTPRLLALGHFGGGTISSPPGHARHVSVLGSTILQLVLCFSKEASQPYWASLAAMKPEDLAAVVKDGLGGRVLEVFLSSKASHKLKQRAISKLTGRFGELAKLPSGSHTVEKCFLAADLRLKEAIAGEFMLRPEEWRARQAKSVGMRQAFAGLFGNPDHQTTGEGSSIGSRGKPEEPATSGVMADLEATAASTVPQTQGQVTGVSNEGGDYLSSQVDDSLQAVMAALRGGARAPKRAKAAERKLHLPAKKKHKTSITSEEAH
eukprot:SM000069S20747  [mRNA]  locus=s69:587333:591411:- [translate_table: standard]